MPRPIRYCSECGEYVAEAYKTRSAGWGQYETVLKLIHIDGDGREIFRAHNPK